MTYELPFDWRQAIEARLANRARDTGAPFDRLRRKLVVGRLLVRLEAEQPGRWILKGGMALEFRIGNRARATRDVDVVARAAELNGEELRAEVQGCLDNDPHGDRFEFIAENPRELEPDTAGRPGWRIPIEARLAGREFARVRLDVVARADEVTATERLLVGGELSFAGIGPLDIEVVDRRQHFAEKLHAFTRNYGDRENSRVRDLPDMMILIQDGLAPDAELCQAVVHVFDVRATHELPVELPDPPITWRDSYAVFAADLDVPEGEIDEAMATLRNFWSATRETKGVVHDGKNEVD